MRSPLGPTPGGCRSNCATSDSFMPNTASESRYWLPATNRCVVTGKWPGAETIMWMWPGRYGWRPSHRPIGRNRIERGPDRAIDYRLGNALLIELAHARSGRDLPSAVRVVRLVIPCQPTLEFAV